MDSIAFCSFKLQGYCRVFMGGIRPTQPVITKLRLYIVPTFMTFLLSYTQYLIKDINSLHIILSVKCNWLPSCFHSYSYLIEMSPVSSVL